MFPRTHRTVRGSAGSGDPGVPPVPPAPVRAIMWLAVGADDPAVGTNVVDQGGTHMRLGKEQAAGYVEDTESAAVPRTRGGSCCGLTCDPGRLARTATGTSVLTSRSPASSSRTRCCQPTASRPGSPA